MKKFLAITIAVVLTGCATTGYDQPSSVAVSYQKVGGHEAVGMGYRSGVYSAPIVVVPAVPAVPYYNQYQIDQIRRQQQYQVDQIRRQQQYQLEQQRRQQQYQLEQQRRHQQILLEQQRRRHQHRH